MLVLSRRKDQRIRFPGLGITVKILDIRTSKVQVGVEAPEEVRVLRDEIEDFGEDPRGPKSLARDSEASLPHGRTRQEVLNSLIALRLLVNVYREWTTDLEQHEGRDPASTDKVYDAITRQLDSLSKEFSSPEQRQSGERPGQKSVSVSPVLSITVDQAASQPGMEPSESSCLQASGAPEVVA